MSADAFAQAKDGPWMVRVRAVNMASANSDSTGLGLSINDKVIPDFDVSYFFTPNIAAELLLTIPQQHDLSSSVLGGKIGTITHLPPTLLLQYHFNANGFKPYLGTDVSVGGANLGTLKVDPLLGGVGIGWRFQARN